MPRKHSLSPPRSALIVAGVLGLSTTFLLPIQYPMLSVANGCLAAILIAVGTRRRPAINASAAGRQIHLRTIAVATVVLAVSFAVLSARLRNERVRQTQVAKATQRIHDFGGTRQQSSITLAGTKVTDDDLLLLQDVGVVRSLNLGTTEITNDGLPHIPWNNLIVLTLSGTTVDDSGIARIPPTRTLRTLALRKTRVTGIAFPVATFPDLRQLDLSLCPISKEGLHGIVQMDVQHLSLNETNLDDTDVDTLMRAKVETLDLTKTNISKQGIQRLKRARPDIRIRWQPPKVSPESTKPSDREAPGA